MATIIYSILGIPLFMVCMVNIGDTMANTFRSGRLISNILPKSCQWGSVNFLWLYTI